MAYFFGDGFDLYALPADAINGYWDSGATASVSLTAGRFAGSRALLNGGAAAWLVKSSGQNDAIHHIVCAFQQTSALSGAGLGIYFQLTDGTTNQCCIVFRQDGAILLTSATPGGTILATYTGAVTAVSTWYAFEFEVVINNTTGSFAVRKNGNTVNDFSATALNTRPGTNNYANKLTVGAGASVNGQTLDDLLWRSDASSVPWVGDIRCYTRMPNTDTSAVWSRSGSGSMSQSLAPFSSGVAVNATQARLGTFTINNAGSINSVTIVTNASVTGNMKCAIWADNAGSPGVVLGSAGPQASVAAGNNVFTITPAVPVVSGQRIWVGAMNDTAAGTWACGASNAVGGFISASFATFPQASPVLSTPTNFLQCSITYSLSGNSSCVQEPQQDAASTYVFSANVGDTDRYTLTNISSTPGTVLGVTTRGYFQKSDAGTRNVAVQLTSGGVTVEGANSALNTVWGWLYRTDLIDPATGAAWNATGVNNAQIGATVKA